MSSSKQEMPSTTHNEQGLASLDAAGLSTLVSKHPMTFPSSSGLGSNDPTLAINHEEGVPVLQFSSENVACIVDKIKQWKNLGLDPARISLDNFVLSTAEKQLLDRGVDIVHHGPGVFILRGLDPSTHSDEDNLSIFLGLANYIGDVRGVQNGKGDMITHITDALQWNVPYSNRHGIHTNGNLPFHNDMGADILALQVRQVAAEGGHTYVASVGKVFLELTQSRPDVVDALLRADWPIQVSGTPTRFALVPLVKWHNGNMMVSLDPGRLGLHPSTARPLDIDNTVPPLTKSQLEALSVLTEVASKHRIRIDTQPGDLVFINNWAHLHARDSYTDSAHETGPRRHLVRLWLRNSKLGWDVPTDMRVQWEAAFGPDGMGDSSKEKGNTTWRGKRTTQRNYPVKPAREYKVPKYTSGSAAFVLEDSDDETSDVEF